MRNLEFRSIDYATDPFARQAANLIWTDIYANTSHRKDPAGAYALKAKSRDFETYCAETDGQLVAVGALALSRSHDTNVWIEDVAVVSDQRGNKVGTFLMGRLEERAIEAGADRARLVSTAGAIGFYEKLGYEPIGRPDAIMLAKLLG